MRRTWEYFDIDPVLFRLLFVAVTLLGGSGVLIYIILWLVIPEDTSKAKDTDDTLKRMQAI
jgi:phage shock protein PspC (stress-responsive transcriptional regulator)